MAATSLGRSLVEVVARVLWLATFAVAGFSGTNFVITRIGASEASAPQIAALAAEAMAPTVIAYVIARAWDEALRLWPKSA